jgi:hypothetical protein
VNCGPHALFTAYETGATHACRPDSDSGGPSIASKVNEAPSSIPQLSAALLLDQGMPWRRPPRHRCSQKPGNFAGAAIPPRSSEGTIQPSEEASADTIDEAAGGTPRPDRRPTLVAELIARERLSTTIRADHNALLQQSRRALNGTHRAIQRQAGMVAANSPGRARRP